VEAARISFFHEKEGSQAAELKAFSAIICVPHPRVKNQVNRVKGIGMYLRLICSLSYVSVRKRTTSLATL
jgi:hypothetical protein